MLWSAGTRQNVFITSVHDKQREWSWNCIACPAILNFKYPVINAYTSYAYKGEVGIIREHEIASKVFACLTVHHMLIREKLE